MWSPHKDTLSDFFVGRNLRESVCWTTSESLLGKINKKNKEDILDECIPIKDWIGSCVDDAMSAEFNEGIYDAWEGVDTDVCFIWKYVIASAICTKA